MRKFSVLRYLKQFSLLIFLFSIIGALLIFRPFRIWDALVFIMGAALVLNGLADLDIIRRFW